MKHIIVFVWFLVLLTPSSASGDEIKLALTTTKFHFDQLPFVEPHETRSDVLKGLEWENKGAKLRLELYKTRRVGRRSKLVYGLTADGPQGLFFRLTFP